MKYIIQEPDLIVSTSHYYIQIETKIVSCHTADSKPVKQEVNGTVMVPPLVFHAPSLLTTWVSAY
jgi:hypothetical protein